MAVFSPQRVFSFRSLVLSFKSRRGFTLLELLISTALFTLTVTALIVIFVVITSIQVKESGVTEVNQQSQFLLGQIQYYIQNARLVDMTADSAASTLKLRESDPTKDPTYITLGSNITNGLLGWWKFDETSGTSTADSSGNGNTGTVKPNATGVWVAGHINNAANLDGTSQYVDVANPSNFNFDTNQPFTLAAWVYRNSSADTDDEIMAKLKQTTGYGYSLFMVNDGATNFCNTGSSCTTNCLIVNFTGNSTICAIAQGNTSVTPGAWHYVVATYDGSQDVSGFQIYVDGVAQSLSTIGTTMGLGSTNTQDLLIGQDIKSSSDYFGGKIDDARVYNRVLSASEVQQLYNNSTVYLQQTDSGTPTPLTSNKVSVSSLNFTRHYQIASSTAIGNESVSYSFTMSASSPNGSQVFSQALQSSAAVLAPVPKIALIQKAMGENNNTGISTVSSTYSGANTAGNLLVAVVSNQGSAPSPPTVADTAGNTWTNIASTIVGSISLIQMKAGDSSSSVKTLNTAVSSTAAGNALIVAIGLNSNASVTGVGDDKGDKFVSAGVRNAPGGALTTEIWYTTSTTAGVTNVSTTASSATGDFIAYVYEVSGLDPSNMLDATGTSTGNSATVTGPSLTTHSASEFLVSNAYVSNIATGLRAGSAWTSDPILFGDPSAHLITSQTTTTSAVWNQNVSGGYSASGATFKSTMSNSINVFAAPNVSGGANTVTATFNSGTANNASLMLYEYRGANTTLSVDASSSQTQASTTTPSSGFVNPQANVELLLGVSAYNNLIDTWTPGLGYTLESSSTVSATLAEDRVIYVMSPVDASWSINNARTTLDLVVGLH